MATAIEPASVIALAKPAGGVGHQVAQFHSDRPLSGPPALGFGSGYDGEGAVDELFYNDSGDAIAAGDWCSRDVTGLVNPGTFFDSSSGVALFPTSPVWIYRRILKSPASADAVAVVGVAMEAIADGAIGRVRRRGLIIPSAHGVTPAITGVFATGSVYGLQISGTAGTAEQAGATTERMIGRYIKVGTEKAIEVTCC